MPNKTAKPHTVEDCIPTFQRIEETLIRHEVTNSRIADALEKIAEHGAKVESHEKRLDGHDKLIDKLFEDDRDQVKHIQTIELRHAEESGAQHVREGFWRLVRNNLSGILAVIVAFSIIMEKYDVVTHAVKWWEKVFGK